MKKLLLFGALCASTSLVQAAPQVNWRTDYAAALKESKRVKKPIFIDFYTDWCGPCKMLDQKTHRDPSFIRESRNWVMVKLNPEKSATNAKLAEKFGVTGFPTMTFVGSNGQKLGEFSGFALASWQEWLAPSMKAAKAKFRR